MYSVPPGANDSPPLTPGVDAYTVVVGLMLLGLEIRQTEPFSDPPPAQESLTNKSPLSGSVFRKLAQVIEGATVLTSAPVTGLISMTAPVKKSPVVAFCAPYSLPSKPKERSSMPGPSGVGVIKVAGPMLPPDGPNL